MRSTFCKGLVRTVAFLLCLTLALGICARALREQIIMDTESFEQPEDSIDVLFLGNCHCYSTFIPSIIQEETGMSAYVLGASSQDIPVTYYYLEEAFKTQSPSYVVLETFPITIYESYVGMETIEAYSHLGFSAMPLSLDYFAYAWDYTDGKGVLSYWFDLLYFHDNWEQVQGLEQSPPRIAQDNGYAVYWIYEPLDRPEEPLELVQTDELAPLDPTGEEYLYRIMDLVEENDSTLILVTVPYTSMTEIEAARYNTIDQIAQENDIPYYNFTKEEFLEDYGFLRGYMIDTNHVNEQGSLLLTEFLSEELLKMEAMK